MRDREFEAKIKEYFYGLSLTETRAFIDEMESELVDEWNELEAKENDSE